MSRKVNHLRGRLRELQRRVRAADGNTGLLLAEAERHREGYAAAVSESERLRRELREAQAERKNITDLIGGLRLQVVPQEHYRGLGYKTFALTLLITPDAYAHAFLYAPSADRSPHLRDLHGYARQVGREVGDKVTRAVLDALAKATGGLAG